MLQFIKRYKITCCILLAIWVLCFMPVPETPLSEVRLMDKWVHILMYLALGLAISYEYCHTNHRQTNGEKLLVYAWLLPSLMGGLIEILQAYCTGGQRSGDWLDLFADVIGATLAVSIGILWARWRANS